MKSNFPILDGKFPPEKGRYHLYVALGCPWAHRVLILRKMKNLENVISLNVVHFARSHHGWHFDDRVKIIFNSPKAFGEF